MFALSNAIFVSLLTSFARFTYTKSSVNFSFIVSVSTARMEATVETKRSFLLKNNSLSLSSVLSEAYTFQAGWSTASIVPSSAKTLPL